MLARLYVHAYTGSIGANLFQIRALKQFIRALQQLSFASSNTFVIAERLKQASNECEQRHSGRATQCKLPDDEVANPTASLIDT